MIKKFNLKPIYKNIYIPDIKANEVSEVNDIIRTLEKKQLLIDITEKVN